MAMMRPGATWLLRASLTLSAACGVELSVPTGAAIACSSDDDCTGGIAPGTACLTSFTTPRASMRSTSTRPKPWAALPMAPSLRRSSPRADGPGAPFAVVGRTIQVFAEKTGVFKAFIQAGAL